MGRGLNPSDRLERLEQLLLEFPIAIVNMDARGRVRSCNPAFEQLFLCDAAEARGKSLKRLVGITRTTNGAAALYDLLEGRDVHVTMQALRRDGSVIDVEFYGVGDGAPSRTDLWGVFQDVTAPEGTLAHVTRMLIDSQEQERLHVSRDLHDDIGQRLAVWQMGIDRLRASMAPADSDTTRAIESLREEASAISAAIRTLSRELYSPALLLLRIDEALEELCTEMAAQLDMHITFRSERIPRSVPIAVSVCLFRVLQDALRNAARYRRAREASVLLNAVGSTLHLRIRDSGGRISTVSARDHELRLITMRERVAGVNGTFSQTWIGGRGAEIDILIPLDRPPS